MLVALFFGGIVDTNYVGLNHSFFIYYYYYYYYFKKNTMESQKKKKKKKYCQIATSRVIISGSASMFQENSQIS
jgi:hypothetical protein